VLAIEPNPDMRARMSKLFGSTTTPQIEIIDATAENTALPSASIDLVAAGRAFHWFDRERALAEFRRILKPRGWIALVAADRDRETDDPVFRPQIEAWEGLLAEHGTDYTRVRSGYRGYEKMDNFFNGDLHQARLHSTRDMDWLTFRGHAMSLSVTPQPGHANYDAFQRGLRLHFDTFACAGILTIPTTCWITAGRLGPQ
jgi:SAM-dependent methyltransferase